MLSVHGAIVYNNKNNLLQILLLTNFIVRQSKAKFVY